MKYINTKTRVAIDSPCKVSGGNWVLQEEKPAKEIIRVEKAEEAEKVENNAEDNDELAEESETEIKEESAEKINNEKGPTRKDLMQELDAFGIEYDKKAKRDELLKLVEGASK